MTEVIATVTSKGQVTIPKSIRDLLRIELRDRVVFSVASDGSVTVRALKYPTVASLAGAAGVLGEPAEGDLVTIARTERALRRKK